MFFVLIWFPIGLIFMSVVMFAFRKEFPVSDVDDFLNNSIAFFAGAVVWPVVLVALFLMFIYELLYER